MVSKGQFVGLDWNRITRLHSQVMIGTQEVKNSLTASRCPKTYFLEKAFIKARAPRRGIPVSNHCASKSKTSLLTGLSNLEPLPVSPVADWTHLDHQDSWLRSYPKAICFSETGFPSVIPHLQP